MKVEPYLNLNIRVKLNQAMYYGLLLTMEDLEFDGRYVKERDAKRWLRRAVVGKITKEKLDK